jgi:hypothetical protein
MNFEFVVRPFQTQDVTPPTRIPGEPKIVDPPVLLIGAESSKIFILDVAISTNVEVVENKTTYKETERATHVERVENPDDPLQHVDMTVTDSFEAKDTKANPIRKKQTDLVHFDFQATFKKFGG